MKTLLSIAIVGSILYKLIPFIMGMNGIDMLFAIGFIALALFAFNLYRSMLNAYTTFRR